LGGMASPLLLCSAAFLVNGGVLIELYCIFKSWCGDNAICFDSVHHPTVILIEPTSEID